MLLIDISMVFHRCYHAMDHLKNSKGVPTGMEYGTLRLLDGLQNKEEFKDHRMVLCFDNFRREDRPSGYKAGRSKKPEDFYKRIDRLSECLKSLYPFSIEDNTEADTLLHSLSVRDGFHFIYTNDKDLLQSISDSCWVVKSHAGKLHFWDKDKVWNKFQIRSHQWALYRALVGDPSDNLPKCKGLGPAWCAEFIRAAYNEELQDETGCIPIIDILKSIVNNANLSKNQKINWGEFRVNQLEHNYNLIKLPVVETAIQNPMDMDMKAYFEELEIKSLGCNETEF